jgi:hypothetical protein
MRKQSLKRSAGVFPRAESASGHGLVAFGQVLNWNEEEEE